MKSMQSFQELVAVRFFLGDKARRARYIKQYPGRWENDSAFIRAACQFFMRHIDEEKIKTISLKKMRKVTK